MPSNHAQNYISEIQSDSLIACAQDVSVMGLTSKNKIHGFGKSLAPYRIRKRPHKQEMGKIHQKYRKSNFLCIFGLFLPYFEGWCVFLSCRGPSVSQTWMFLPPANGISISRSLNCSWTCLPCNVMTRLTKIDISLSLRMSAMVLYPPSSSLPTISPQYKNSPNKEEPLKSPQKQRLSCKRPLEGLHVCWFKPNFHDQQFLASCWCLQAVTELAELPGTGERVHCERGLLN